MEISQRLCGKSYSVSGFKRTPVLADSKYFFVRCNGKIYRLGCGEGISFRCDHEIEQTVLYECFTEFEAKISVCIPTKGHREIWNVELHNISDSGMDFEVFAAFPFANILEYQGLFCRYDADQQIFIKSCFPYYITYNEYKKAEENVTYSYAKSSIPPESTETCLRRFFGGDMPFAVPSMVSEGRGSNKNSEMEDTVAAFHHIINVGKDSRDSISYQFGLVKSLEELTQINTPDYSYEYEKLKGYWKRYLDPFYVSTGHCEIDYLVNFWIKKQLVYLCRHNRGGVYCNVRNQLQDAMGYSVLDPQGAYEQSIAVIKRQQSDGYLKQWNMTDGSEEIAMCRLNHSDAPIWLIMCMTGIIENTGDLSKFDEVIPYADGSSGTVEEHICQAATYMDTQLGAHGLCLLKDGDWLDPINGPGRNGKGESVWNTLALIYAIKAFCKLRPNNRLSKIADKLTAAVNKWAWDCDRYIVGFDDDGKPFGAKDDEEGNLFLNTQTWALIAGVCDEERSQIVRETIKQLKTNCGYRILTPAFTKYNPTWGKISVKHPGTAENGAVYCHGTMFKAFADCLTGHKDEALETILSILPTSENNSPEDNLQVPIFVPNYYFGVDGDNFGRSSFVNNTGSPAWIILLFERYFSEYHTSKP